MLNSHLRQIALLILLLLGTTSAYATERYFLRIGTGSISGVYYATGNAVCRFLKKHSVADKTEGIFCSVQSTPGAMYNLNALRNGDLEVAASQGDWAYNMHHGTGQFSSLTPMTSLRSLFATHKEAFTVLVRTDSNIESFDEIKGKIVNIGAPGTGVRGTIENIMKVKGWATRDFKVATELNSSEQVQALCDGKIDVMTTVIGHPSGLFQEALATCGVKFISLDNETRQRLVSDYPYYYSYEIPTDLYPGVSEQESVETIAVKSVFYVREDLPHDKAYKLVNSLFQNFSTLQSIHPALANLTKVDLVPENVDIPIHPGAEEYYKKIGLLRD